MSYKFFFFSIRESGTKFGKQYQETKQNCAVQKNFGIYFGVIFDH